MHTRYIYIYLPLPRYFRLDVAPRTPTCHPDTIREPQARTRVSFVRPYARPTKILIEYVGPTVAVAVVTVANAHCVRTCSSLERTRQLYAALTRKRRAALPEKPMGFRRSRIEAERSADTRYEKPLPPPPPPPLSPRRYKPGRLAVRIRLRALVLA